MRSVTFFLHISADDYLNYYSGQVKWVLARSVDGLKVQFPANLLAPYVSHNGVQGKFVLQYLANGKAVDLSRISP